jgi:hypothetical protein
MLPVQSIIVALTISIAIGLLLYFFQKNKKIKTDHLTLLLELEKKVIRSATQIKDRNKGLDAYHFLKYNLSEALIIQPEIKF